MTYIKNTVILIKTHIEFFISENSEVPMEALFISNQQEISQIIAFTIESKFKIKTSVVPNSSEGLSRLLEDKPIDLIIFHDIKECYPIYKYLLSMEANIPCILIKTPDFENEPLEGLKIIGFVNEENAVEEIQAIISDAIHKGQLKENDQTDDFIRIKTELLIRVYPLQGDIYIRLSNIKFVKVFHKGSVFGAEEFQKYVQKKRIDYLYIKASEVTEFVQKFSQSLRSFTASAQITKEKALQMARSVHEVIYNLTQTIGFTDYVQELAKETVLVTLKSIDTNHKMKDALASLARDQTKYLSNHSLVVAHLSCCIASMMDWPSDTTYKKLVYASLYHDMSLRNPLLAQMHNMDEVMNHREIFSWEDIENYRKHPIDAAQFMLNFPELPPDVDTIIRQHHERPMGNGIPRGLTVSFISPLAAIFIVAHDLVQFILDNEGKMDINAFCSKFKEEYDRGTFKKILNAIKKDYNIQ